MCATVAKLKWPFPLKNIRKSVDKLFKMSHMSTCVCFSASCSGLIYRCGTYGKSPNSGVLGNHGLISCLQSHESQWWRAGKCCRGIEYKHFRLIIAFYRYWDASACRSFYILLPLFERPSIAPLMYHSLWWSHHVHSSIRNIFTTDGVLRVFIFIFFKKGAARVNPPKFISQSIIISIWFWWR